MVQAQMFPWDDWEKEAIARGVPKELAALGRSVMREWHEHQWKDFGNEVGYDSAMEMIRLALKHPDKAKNRWKHLLDTDGETVRFLPDGTILDYHTGRKYGS